MNLLKGLERIIGNVMTRVGEDMQTQKCGFIFYEPEVPEELLKNQ